MWWSRTPLTLSIIFQIHRIMVILIYGCRSSLLHKFSYDYGRWFILYAAFDHAYYLSFQNLHLTKIVPPMMKCGFGHFRCSVFMVGCHFLMVAGQWKGVSKRFESSSLIGPKHYKICEGGQHRTMRLTKLIKEDTRWRDGLEIY